MATLKTLGLTVVCKFWAVRFYHWWLQNPENLQVHNVDPHCISDMSSDSHPSLSSSYSPTYVISVRSKTWCVLFYPGGDSRHTSSCSVYECTHCAQSHFSYLHLLCRDMVTGTELFTEEMVGFWRLLALL